MYGARGSHPPRVQVNGWTLGVFTNDCRGRVSVRGSAGMDQGGRGGGACPAGLFRVVVTVGTVVLVR